MTGVLDWAGRVVMLVLAGMITLSIIGAIAAIPSGTVETQMGIERGEWPQPQPEAEPQPVPPAPALEETPREPAASLAVQSAGAVSGPPPEEPVDAAEWLEAITYALLALVGIALFAAILLLRALGHWRRTADALEILAGRPRG